MVLSKEEKRIRHNQQQREYTARKKAKIQQKDPAALKQKARDERSQRFSVVKRYIKKEASKNDISLIRDLLADRVKLLNKAKNKK